MLGEDLDKYLKEAEGELEAEEKKGNAPGEKEKLTPIQGNLSVFDPFVGIFKGFADIGKTFVPSSFIVSKPSGVPSPTPAEISKAGDTAARSMWMVYKNYKKAHGLLSW
jgi:hypothetical protein